MDLQLDTLVSSRLSITLSFTALLFLAFFAINRFFSDLVLLSYFMPIFGVLCGFLSLIFNFYLSLRAIQLRNRYKLKQILVLNPVRVVVMSILVIVMWAFLAIDHNTGSFFMWFLVISIGVSLAIMIVPLAVWCTP